LRDIYQIDANTGDRSIVIQSASSDVILDQPQFSPDGRTLYYVVSHLDSRQVKLMSREIDSSHEEELLELKDERDLPDLSVALSPDGRQFALAIQKRASSGSGVDNQISIMSIKGGQPKELWRPGGLSSEQPLAWTPDGKAILCVRRPPERGRELWFVPVNGGKARRICDRRELMCQGMMYGALHSALDVHPDGKRIAFDCFEYRHEVWAMANFLPEVSARQVIDTAVKPTFTKLQIPSKISWEAQLSPDGKEIALVSDKKLWITPRVGKLKPDYPGPARLLDTRSVPVDWAGFTWSGDGKWIAFTGGGVIQEEGREGNQNIFIVPAEGGEPRQVHENNRHARIVNYRMSLSPDGKTLAFASLDGKKIYIETIPVDGGLPKRLVESEAREPAFSPDGEVIAFVENRNLGVGGGGLWTVLANGGTPTLVAEAKNASSPIWSPDGRMLAFIDSGAGGYIYIVPVAEDGKPTGEQYKVELPEGTKRARRLAGWTPDNKIGGIFAKKTEFALYSQPVEGGKATFLAIGGYPVQPRWSPDGKRIYHTNSTDEASGDWARYAIAYIPAEGGDVTTVPLQSEDKIRIWAYGAGNHVSPDGTTVVFAGQRAQDKNTVLNIWTFPIEGGEAKQLTDAPSPFTDWYPCWSPDGKTLAFVRTQTSKDWQQDMMVDPSIYIIPSEGGKARKLTSEAHAVCAATPIAWSPDGKLIAYFSRDKDAVDGTLKVIPADGGQSRVVAQAQSIYANKELAWSPDSKQIAFNGAEERTIKIVSLEGGNVREIKVDLVDTQIYHLDWSPDGEQLVFAGMRGGGPEFWMIEDFLPPTYVAGGK
jgi:Tol biopolymer transport system component